MQTRTEKYSIPRERTKTKIRFLIIIAFLLVNITTVLLGLPNIHLGIDQSSATVLRFMGLLGFSVMAPSFVFTWLEIKQDEKEQNL